MLLILALLMIVIIVIIVVVGINTLVSFGSISNINVSSYSNRSIIHRNSGHKGSTSNFVNRSNNYIYNGSTSNSITLRSSNT